MTKQLTYERTARDSDSEAEQGKGGRDTMQLPQGKKLLPSHT